uniref:Uncharacterized protein n=1 Tax=Rhizophora mucronata TaxID=61149 RepID=A0A2P2NEE5_RHIMU
MLFKLERCTSAYLHTFIAGRVLSKKPTLLE